MRRPSPPRVRLLAVAILLCSVLAPFSRVRAEPSAAGMVFVCPMDPDVRRSEAGACPRCGMKLYPTPGASFERFALDVRVTPADVPAGRDLEMAFGVLDPVTHRPTQDLHVVHERPFHLFIVSGDLAWFEHIHPEPSQGDSFVVHTRLPKPGHYQLFADFFPSGGMPQLEQRGLVTAGYTKRLEVGRLVPDPSPLHVVDGLRFALSKLTLVAGRENQLELVVTDGAGQRASDLEPYLGAGLHAILVSDDLASVVHTHGDLSPARPGVVVFDVRPPRPGIYRMWLQVQRKERVVTVPFTVRAEPARPSP